MKLHVTVTGLSGSGKEALALRLARELSAPADPPTRVCLKGAQALFLMNVPEDQADVVVEVVEGDPARVMVPKAAKPRVVEAKASHRLWPMAGPTVPASELPLVAPGTRFEVLRTEELFGRRCYIVRHDGAEHAAWVGLYRRAR